MSSNFEAARSNFESNLDQARDTIGDLNIASNMADRKQLLVQSRKLIEECKKNIHEMDYLWNTLDPSDKGYYKSELTEFKQQFEQVRRDFTEYEKAIRRDEEDEGSDELGKLQANTREKLLGGVNKLSDQERDLQKAVSIGYEAQNMVREGAKNLRNQRDYIENAGRNNLKAQTELSKADKVVKTIRVREFCYRLILYLLIICLFAAILAVFVVKIK